MIHPECQVTAPHKKHPVNVGTMAYDMYEDCTGIPTADELLRIERKKELRDFKLAAKRRKATRRHTRKLARLAARG